MSTNVTIKVYASQTIFDHPLVFTDYSIPFSSVYALLARRYIEQYKNLQILSEVETYAPLGADEVPTWAPDWRNQRIGAPLHKTSSHPGINLLYKASNGLPL